jgi:uncharacterized protein (DUF1501 family)
MKRRDFLSTSLKGAVVPFFLNGLGVSRAAAASFLPAGICNFNNRAMVIIHLAGANDMLNGAIPLSQFGEYKTARPDIHIPQSKLINLDANLPDLQKLGLNPALQGFKSLYDGGQLSILQRAGYPLPNRSHFFAESIWLRGVQGDSPANEVNEEGWIGRFLRDKYPTYQGLPFGDQSDPLAIMMGSGSAAGFHTQDEHDYYLNMAGQDPAGFYNVIASLSGEPITSFPNSQHGDTLEYISAIEKSTQIYSNRISTVFNAGSNTKTYPNTALGNQLKTIARFMKGGSSTKVFFARTGGWDTHINQVDLGDTTKGTHAVLLKDLADSLKIFQDDLAALGLADRVMTVVFSEFGRKIVQSASIGTDHGTLSSMFVVGKHVKAGVVGDGINLSDRDSQGAPNPLQLQNDNRGVFASLLKNWLGASDTSIQAAFPTTAAAILKGGPALVTPTQAVDATCYFSPIQPIAMKVKAQVFLEGYLNAATGKMHTTLSTTNKLPLAQPFNNTDYNYSGTETVTTFPTGTVDWILCELRTKFGFAAVATKACLLREDGSIMDITGNTTLSFTNMYPDMYHLAIFHRSHIGIMSSGTTNADATVVSSFLMDAVSKARGVNQLKAVGGKMAMVAGDTNNDGSINADDYAVVRRNNTTLGYKASDFDGNNTTDFVAGDKLLLDGNRSRVGLPDLFAKLIR